MRVSLINDRRSNDPVGSRIIGSWYAACKLCPHGNGAILSQFDVCLSDALRNDVSLHVRPVSSPTEINVTWH